MSTRQARIVGTFDARWMSLVLALVLAQSGKAHADESSPPASDGEPGMALGGKFTIAGGPVPMVTLQFAPSAPWSFRLEGGASYTGLGALTRVELNLRRTIGEAPRWRPFVQGGAAHTWLSESNVSDGSLHLFDVHASVGYLARMFEPWLFSAELGVLAAPDPFVFGRNEEGDEDALPVVPFASLEASYAF